MTRNVTLKLDESLLKKCRQLAILKDKSLSQWVSELMQRAVKEDAHYASAKRRALKRLETGFELGGTALTREQAHER